MPRRRVVLAPLIVAAVVATVALTARRGPADAEAIPTAVPAVGVRTVLVAKAIADPVPFVSSGTLTSARHSQLGFAVGGRVIEIVADEGDAVSAGAPLARLDGIPYEAAMDEAAARVRFLESRAARSRELLDAGRDRPRGVRCR